MGAWEYMGKVVRQAVGRLFIDATPWTREHGDALLERGRTLDVGRWTTALWAAGIRRVAGLSNVEAEETRLRLVAYD